MGWTLITAVCRLLCGEDIPLLTRVILDGGEVASEFSHSCTAQLLSPVVHPSQGQGSSRQPLPLPQLGSLTK